VATATSSRETSSQKNLELFWLGRWLRAHAALALSAVLATMIVSVAVAGPAIAPYSPTTPDILNRLLPPSGDHLFGTDHLGRDIFSRVIAGARVSLGLAALIMAIAVPIGVLLGILAGYWGGRLDAWISRVTDAMFAFPSLVLAMAINAALRPSIASTVIAVSAVWWPSYTRLLRGQVIAIKHVPFVEAARSLGASDGRIIRRHILPNVVGPLLVKITNDLGHALVIAAGLSFIGLGVQPPTPEWGAMVAEGRAYLLDFWWYAVFPGLAIAVTVLSFAFLGDAIHELLEPRSRRS